MNKPDQVAKINIMPGRLYLVIFILIVGDALSFSLVFTTATLLRGALIPWIGGVIRWDIFFPLLELTLASLLITYALMGLYPGFGRTAVEEMQVIISSLTIGYGVLGLAVYFRQAGLDFPRTVFVMSWVLSVPVNLITRFAIRNRVSFQKWWGTPVIVVGGGAELAEVIEKLIRNRRLGLRPVLILNEKAPEDRITFKGILAVRDRQVMQIIAAYYHIEYVVLVESDLHVQEDGANLLSWLSKSFPIVLLVMKNSPLGSLWVKTMDLEGRLTLRAQYHLLDRKAIFLKRATDLILGSMIFIFTLPLSLLIALWIKLDSPGPVLFAQERLGKGGKHFHCLKFRTMVVGAEQELEKIMQKDPHVYEEYVRHHKLTKDPRITRVGRILRKFSLDELPQFWHVLSGELSLVGPRAYLPRELTDMGSYSNLILKIHPGITGWWQVMGRHSTTFEQRLQLDEYYLGNWSLWLDAYIIIKTIWVIFSGQGA